MTYWLPPLARSLFGGPPETAPIIRIVVETLRRGGGPAARLKDARVASALTSAVMVPAIAAIEADGWSLGRFVRGPGPDRATASAPWFGGLLRGWSLSAVMRLLPQLAPFDVEGLIHSHFTKVAHADPDDARGLHRGGPRRRTPGRRCRTIARGAPGRG